MKPRLIIKTEQQPDATWKAWPIGGRLVVFAKTKAKAIGIVKMFLGNKEETPLEDLDSQADD